MINEGHISVTAKKDYVLLCAIDWKTELRGWLRLAMGEDVRRTQEGGRTARGR